MTTWSGRPALNFTDFLTAEKLKAILDQIDALSGRLAVLQSTHAAGAGTTSVVSTNLARPVLASTYVLAVANIYYKATTGGDIKFDFDKPSGATLVRGSLFSLPASVDSATGDVYLGSDASNLQNLSAPGRTSAADIMRAKLIAVYLVSTTAGNITLQYGRATGTGTATDTQVMSGSTLKVEPCDGV